MFAHHIKQLHGEMGRIGIVQPDPFHSFNGCHLVHQLGDVLTAINVYTIICQLLCDDLKLLDTFFDQFSHLVRFPCLGLQSECGEQGEHQQHLFHTS